MSSANDAPPAGAGEEEKAAEEEEEVQEPEVPEEEEDPIDYTALPYFAFDGVLTAFDTHEAVLFTGDIPAPLEEIGKELATVPFATQRSRAIELYDLLSSSQPSDVLRLNSDSILRTALLHIPNTECVKVVYGLGVWTPGLACNAKDYQVLALTGRVANAGSIPQVLAIDIDATKKQEIPTMTHAEFVAAMDTKLREGKDVFWPLGHGARATQNNPVMQIAPIPAFLVYDGFGKDLDAIEVYERVLSVRECRECDMFAHLRAFLRTCLITHNNSKVPRPFVKNDTFFKAPPQHALEWAVARFKALMPSSAAPVGAATTHAGDLPPNLAKLVETMFTLHANTSGTPTKAAGSDEKKDDETVDAACGLADDELKAALRMCGKDEDGDGSALPTWWTKVASKKLGKNFKLNFIRDAIEKTVVYEDAEVPITQVMLKQILEKNWLGKSGNVTRPSLTDAADGLSPFMVLDMDDEEVARINAHSDAMDIASLITVSDASKSKQHLVARVPESLDELVLILKRFANLLAALFSKDCVLFQALQVVLDAFKDYKGMARATMSHYTRGVIMWIVLLQTRHFACGKTNILAAFKFMQQNIVCKNCEAIHHSDVPPAFLKSNKRKRDSEEESGPGKGHGGGGTPGGNQLKKGSGGGDNTKGTKLSKGDNKNTWHPLLAEKIGPALTKAGNPNFTKVMRYCKAYDKCLFPLKGNVCGPNAYLGKCSGGDKCERLHTLPTDAQAQDILTQLEKLINEPEGLVPKGQ